METPYAFGDSKAKFASLAPWIKDCLECCLDGHQGRCDREELKSSAFSNTKLVLVDVKNACLVETSHHPQYITLSYVWGQVPQLYLTEKNASTLFQQGALFHHRESIPTTIRDAMDLVAAIGYRYLWCDSMSIRQEDAEVKHNQILQMGYVYNNALLTIMAVAGDDASYGIPVASKDPDYKLPMNVSVHAAAHAITRRLSLTSHFTRGWTYQETVLSKRCLYLMSDLVIFLCRSYFQIHRDIRVYSYVSSFLKPNPMADLLGCKLASVAFHIYADAVKEYTNRVLTYPSDRMGAFSGISSAFAELQGWELVEGLPVKMLRLALLWSHSSTLPHLDRLPGNPTWSWSGWNSPSTYELFMLSGVNDVDDFVPMVHHYVVRKNGVMGTEHFLRDIPSQQRGSKNENVEFIQKRYAEYPETLAQILGTQVEETVVPSEQIGVTKPSHTVLIFKPMVVNFEEHFSVESVSTARRKLPYHFSYNSSSLLSYTAITNGSTSETCGFLCGTASDTVLARHWRGTPGPVVPQFKLIAISTLPNFKCAEPLVLFLLVQDHGVYCERMAVGQMVLSAWEAAKPQVEVVKLA